MVADKEFYYSTYHGKLSGRRTWRAAWPVREYCRTA